MTRVILHIGAHKTASTHFQNTLSNAKALLLQHGISYVGPEQLRHEGETLPERFGFPLDRSRHASISDPQQELVGLLNGGHTLLLSEENFVGFSNRRWGKIPIPIYPEATARIDQLTAALQRPIDLLLSVRNPCDYLSSLYSHILLFSVKTIFPEEFLSRNDPLEIAWDEYVQRLAKSSHVRSVTVWPYEAYHGSASELIAHIFGEVGEGIELAKHKYLPRLSEAAVGQILSRRVFEDRTEMRQDIVERLPVMPDNPRMELFSDHEKLQASAQYRRQVQNMHKMDKLTVYGSDVL